MYLEVSCYYGCIVWFVQFCLQTATPLLCARILTAAWADRWPAVCHRSWPDRWAHLARYPNRCCPADPADSPAVPDDCYPAGAALLPALMRNRRMRIRWKTGRSTGDYSVAAPLAAPAAAAAGIPESRLLSVAAAVGRRPRPIHLIVLLTHPNDPTVFTIHLFSFLRFQGAEEDFVCVWCCVVLCVWCLLCILLGVLCVLCVCCTLYHGSFYICWSGFWLVFGGNEK